MAYALKNGTFLENGKAVTWARIMELLKERDRLVEGNVKGLEMIAEAIRDRDNALKISKQMHEQYERAVDRVARLAAENKALKEAHRRDGHELAQVPLGPSIENYDSSVPIHGLTPPDHIKRATHEALRHWKGLKRPDLSEEDKIRGALLQYQMVLDACVTIPKPVPGCTCDAGPGELHGANCPSAWQMTQRQAHRGEQVERIDDLLKELGGKLWELTKRDWIYEVSSIMTEPVAATAVVSPESVETTRYTTTADHFLDAFEHALLRVRSEVVNGADLEGKDSYPMSGLDDKEMVEILAKVVRP